MAKLSDCLTKAKGIGILTDAEMAYVMRRAAELGNEQQAVKEIHAQRMKEYEAIKAPNAADQVVVQTQNETVAMAAYAEEVRNATTTGIQPGAQALEAGRKAGEAAITGQPAPAASAEADIESVRSFLVSPQQQGHTVRPSTEEQQEAALKLGTKLIQLHGIGNVKMQDTFGMYQGSHNRQFVTSFDARHNANLTALVQNVAKEAGRTGQDSIRISRVLEPNEDSDNARPGISVEFKHPIPVERIDDIVRFLRARGIDGFDLVPDGYDVATGTPRTFKALRFEEIPEFSQQPRARKSQVLLELQEELMKMEDVANVSHELYDTVVLTNQDYDKNGILKGAAGGVRAAAWADRAFHASDPQAARKRDEARAAGAQAEVPAPHLGSAEEVASKELETAAALIAAGSKAAPTAVIAYQGIYRRVVALMQENRALLEGKKWSSATPESVKSEALLRALGELDAMLKFVPDEVRGKVGGFFQLAKVGVGEQALAKFFGDRVRTLERVLEQYLKKQYLAEINDLLDKSKAKTTNGIQKSKNMDADANAFVDSATRYSKMDHDEVATEMASLDQRIRAAPDEDTRIIAERDYSILGAFGDLVHRNANDLYSAYTRLVGVVKDGKDAWKQQAQAIKARNDARAAEIVALLGQADVPGVTSARQRAEVHRGINKAWLVEHYSFLQFLDYLLPNLSFAKELQEKARHTENARNDFLIAGTQRLHDAVHNAVGSRSFGSFSRAARRLGIRHTIDFNGKPMDVSKLEAIQHLLTWDQADGKEKMGKANYTEEVIEQLRKLTEDNESQAVLEFLRKEYEATYNLINPIYRANYGVDLPKIALYAPSRYEHVAGMDEVAPFGGMRTASGTTPGFAHQRVSHSAKPLQQNAITVFHQHMNDVAHFMYDAQLLREMRGALIRPDVRESVIQKFGPEIWNDVQHWMDASAGASNTKASDLASMDYMIDTMITGKAVGSLTMSPKSLWAQLDSALRILAERPKKEIVRALMNPIELIKTLPKSFSSPSVTRRIQLGATADTRYLMEKSEFRPTTFMRLARQGLLPLNWWDAALTSVSAAISYRAAWNEAKDMGMFDAAAHEWAMDQMDSSIYRYSQPTGIYNRSLMENTGSNIRRGWMLFLSDQRVKTAWSLELAQAVLRARAQGFGPVRKAMRAFIALEVFAALSWLTRNAWQDWFSDTDDEDLYTMEGFLGALATAPFSGLIIIGSIIESGWALLVENKMLKPNRDPFREVVEKGTQAFQNIEDLWNPDDMQDWLKEVDALAKTTAIGGGIIPAPLGFPVAAAGALTSAITNFLKPLAGAIENAENSD